MDGASEAVLAAAALSQDQNGAEGARRDLLRHGERLLHGGALGHDGREVVLVHALLVGAVEAALELGGLEDPLERDLEAGELEGLGDVVGGALAQGLHGAGEVGEGGHDDDGQLRVPAAGDLEHVEAAVAAQPQVGEDDVRVLGLEGGRGLREVGGDDGLIARVGQVLGQGPPDQLLVIHDQDLRRHVKPPPSPRAGAHRRWCRGRVRFRSKCRRCAP